MNEEIAARGPGPQGALCAEEHCVDLWLVNADNDEQALEVARGILAPDEIARFDRYRIGSKRRQAIAVRAALRQIIARYVGALPAELEFTYSQFQKPHLAQQHCSLPLEFNVTHSGHWGLIAVTAGRPIGVDMEQLRALTNLESLARTVLTPREIDHLSDVPPEERLKSFFEAWTCKEAALKGAGLGISVSLLQIELEFVDAQRRIAVISLQENVQRWQIELLTPTAGYVAAAAVPEGQPFGIVRTITPAPARS